MGIIILHDCVNPKTGLTYKEENLLIKHNIPLETNVLYNQCVGEDENGDNIYKERNLFVLAHVRDCDGSPLYVIGELGSEVYNNSFDNEIYNGRFYRKENINGVREDNLKVVS